MDYYHAWKERAVVLCLFNAAMIIITYWVNPYSGEFQNKCSVIV